MSHGATARSDNPAMRLASDQSMQKMEPNAKINNDVGEGVSCENFQSCRVKVYSDRYVAWGVVKKLNKECIIDTLIDMCRHLLLTCLSLGYFSQITSLIL